MLTFQSFKNNLRELTAANEFCLAYSGGVDSTVLLHLFYELRKQEPNIKVRAIHINHGLSPNAEPWALSCKQACERYQIPLSVQSVTLNKTANCSLEELARNARYNVFSNSLTTDEQLVTAHHQNDQAETLLLQLFRGAGPKGLAAMPSYLPLGKGMLLRPFLLFTREEIVLYAKEMGLAWVEDESNQNNHFDRNFIRNAMLPLLEERWPRVVQNLARAAKHCAEADNFINNQMKDLFHLLYDPKTKSLNITLLMMHSLAMQNYLIRYWLQYLKFPLPSTQKITLLQQEIIKSRQDAMPLLCWKQVEIRRYQNQLYAMRPLFKHDATVIIKWDLTTDLILPNDLGVISKLNLQSLGIDIHQLECAEIRFRQGGERCYLKNRTHSHSLKKLFQQWQVPPWQRDRIPLLYSNNQLKAIIGFVACESLTLPSPTSGRGDNFIPSPTSGRGDNFIPSPTSERGDNLIPSHK